MKTIFLGDIHGRDIWKDIITQEKPDRVVFIGDYFDSFDIKGPKQIENFKDIIAFKESGQCEVIMLIGNHDHHYNKKFGFAETYSGFQSKYSLMIAHVLEQNEHHLQMAYQLDEFLCSHAGISIEFLANNTGVKELEVDKVADIINDLYKERPEAFHFNGLNPYGDNSYQTPIWIRPVSLMSVNKESLAPHVIQVVGHTAVKIDIMDTEVTGGRYFFIDKLHVNHGTFLIYENGETREGAVKRG